MPLRETLYTRFILPATEEACRGLGGRLRHWRAWEQRPLQENRDAQWAAVQRLLRHAWAQSPFHRERMQAAGLSPEFVRTPQDLARLPVLTRADLRASLDQIRSRGHAPRDLMTAASGGTTETPVQIVRDRAGVRQKRSVQEQWRLWAGLRPGDAELYLWGARSDFAENPSWKWRLYDQTLMRRRWLPTSRLDAKTFEQYRLQLNQLKPRVIVAYPTPLQLFSEYLEQCGKPYWRPRSAICTAEALTPEARATMERALECRVFEQYGSREFGLVAGECEEHTRMHLNPHAAYFEFVPLPGAGPDGPHEVLVTDLLNYGMPLLRYRINDCAAGGRWDEQCPCGRGFPLLPPILGRSGDVFRLPDGSVIPGVALNRMPRLAPGIAKIQMIQETWTEFRLRFVPAASFGPSDLDAARITLAKFFPPETHWNFEQVEEIPREPSGKTRFCISRVAAAAPQGAAHGD